MTTKEPENPTEPMPETTVAPAPVVAKDPLRTAQDKVLIYKMTTIGMAVLLAGTLFLGLVVHIEHRRGPGIHIGNERTFPERGRFHDGMDRGGSHRFEPGSQSKPAPDTTDTEPTTSTAHN